MTDGRVLCFVSGLGIGIGVTLLWAPTAGAKTRGALKHQAKEAQKTLKEAQKTFKDTLERGKKAAKTTTEGVVEALEDGKAVLLR
jgi:gas vesicle protein